LESVEDATLKQPGENTDNNKKEKMQVFEVFIFIFKLSGFSAGLTIILSA